jgi:hypothetical protein
MTEKVSSLPTERFVFLWNSSSSLDEVVEKVRAVVGLPCPRWAVMARAAACRSEGASLKRFPGPSSVAAD